MEERGDRKMKNRMPSTEPLTEATGGEMGGSGSPKARAAAAAGDCTVGKEAGGHDTPKAATGGKKTIRVSEETIMKLKARFQQPLVIPPVISDELLDVYDDPEQRKQMRASFISAAENLALVYAQYAYILRQHNEHGYCDIEVDVAEE